MCGWLGETSTEITGAEDLHLEASLQQQASIATLSREAAQGPDDTYNLSGRKAKAGRAHMLLVKKGKKYIFNH